MKDIIRKVYLSFYPNRDLVLYLFVFKFAAAVVLFLPLNILVSETWGNSAFPDIMFKGDRLLLFYETIHAAVGGFKMYIVFALMLGGIAYLIYQFLLAGIYGKLVSRREKKSDQLNLFNYSGEYFFMFLKISIAAFIITGLAVLLLFLVTILFTSFGMTGASRLVIIIWVAVIGFLWFLFFSFFNDCCRAGVILKKSEGLRDAYRSTLKLWKSKKAGVILLTLLLFVLSGIVSAVYLELSSGLNMNVNAGIPVLILLVVQQVTAVLKSIVRFIFISSSVELTAS